MDSMIPKSMIAGVQSVMPVEVTQNREIRPISVEDPLGVGIFRRTFNIVTYYKQEGDDEKGWFVAGWMKESLGRAMTEQPMISGRLRRMKPDDGLELVANDSGVRLVESKFPASLTEFLEMVKRDKSRAEAEVVFWRDIDEDEPQFSPLFYVQVTNFESGGYSIGISCSILIADILLETDFLKNWTQIQSSLAHSQSTIKPIFHLPSIKHDFGCFITDLSRSSSPLHRSDEPLVFRGKTCPEMSLSCIKKAVNVSCEKASVDYVLFVKEQNKNNKECDGTKVVIISKEEPLSDCHCGNDMEELEETDIDKKIGFGESVVSSRWIGSVTTKGVVFVVPSTFGHAKFVVALPSE